MFVGPIFDLQGLIRRHVPGHRPVLNPEPLPKQLEGSILRPERLVGEPPVQEILKESLPALLDPFDCLGVISDFGVAGNQECITFFLKMRQGQVFQLIGAAVISQSRNGYWWRMIKNRGVSVSIAIPVLKLNTKVITAARHDDEF
ncbi:hypothetical protein [Methyloterricola oryzae]|uniref:hypothetical protein n=1 Tax=Methyloterricola oryzae TaxID=1495050 RepID=UPI0011AEC464|nr:hypothetical protein [Methyloterricola oryzae]